MLRGEFVDPLFCSFHHSPPPQTIDTAIDVKSYVQEQVGC